MMKLSLFNNKNYLLKFYVIIVLSTPVLQMCPLPYTARVQSGKILIELEEYDEATDCLETLLDEDDEVPDVWYLLGWANYLHGKEYYSNARHYLHKAKEVDCWLGSID